MGAINEQDDHEKGSEGQELLYTNNEVINKLEVIDGK